MDTFLSKDFTCPVLKLLTPPPQECGHRAQGKALWAQAISLRPPGDSAQ